MANRKHLALFENSSVEKWNKWKQGHPLLRINLSKVDLNAADLTGANLSGANLSGASFYEANRSSHVGRDLLDSFYPEIDLSGVDLRGADLESAILENSNLSGANLSGADLERADFSRMELHGINLSGANLSWTDLSYSNLKGANLSGAQLLGTQLVETDLCNANLRKSHVYGISAWDLKTNSQTQQENLITSNTNKGLLPLFPPFTPQVFSADAPPVDPVPGLIPLGNQGFGNRYSPFSAG